MLTPEKRTQLTYRYDSLRCCFQGVIESGVSSFVLLVAIRIFSAPNWLKACIASSEKVGLFLNAITLTLGAGMKFRRISQLCAIYFLCVGICWFGCCCAINLWMFAIFAILANLCLSQQSPLMIEIYSLNYKAKERGRFLATGLFLQGLIGIFFSKIGGYWLDCDLANFRAIFCAMAIAGLLCAASSFNVPSEPLRTTGNPKLFANFQLLWKDKLFGLMIISWTFLGLGNFMSIPVRVEYLANPKYGINATNNIVALITFIIPAISRLLSIKIWGIVFDRYHFIKVRILLNSFWIIGFLLYF
ncbi:MAG: hypothetical protein A2007_01325, partial [Verrucomicrobia bacterium GWC2_42_7]